jgi:hypothetical protein
MPLTATQENKAWIGAATDNVWLDQTPTDIGRTNVGGIERRRRRVERRLAAYMQIPAAKMTRNSEVSAKLGWPIIATESPAIRNTGTSTRKKASRSMFRLARLVERTPSGPTLYWAGAGL